MEWQECYGEDGGRYAADPNEIYCGSLRLRLPGGDVLPHTQSPIVEVEALKDVEVIIERRDGSQISVLSTLLPLRMRGARFGSLSKAVRGKMARSVISWPIRNLPLSLRSISGALRDAAISTRG
jgi:hypothetical protein